LSIRAQRFIGEEAHNRHKPMRQWHIARQGANVTDEDRADDNRAQIERLVRELDEAELFAQKLHAYIVAIRQEVAAGHAGRALSMCNQALTEIDSATDVVAPSPHLKERAGVEADDTPQGGKRD
jgi:hypothetical protein